MTGNNSMFFPPGALRLISCTAHVRFATLSRSHAGQASEEGRIDLVTM